MSSELCRHRHGCRQKHSYIKHGRNTSLKDKVSETGEVAQWWNKPLGLIPSTRVGVGECHSHSLILLVLILSSVEKVGINRIRSVCLVFTVTEF